MDPAQDDIHRIDFSRIMQRNGLLIADEQVRCLDQFVFLLAEWNRKINLVSRRDVGNLRQAHLLHSLSLLFVFDVPRGVRILDIGTGGGLPGIPLAIVRPDISVVLVDSIQKKTAAVNDIVGRLGLANVSVRTGRAEELPVDTALSNSFSLIVARGVAPLSDLITWSRPFARHAEGGGGEMQRVRQGGGGRPIVLPALVAYKGGDLDTEIRDAEVKCGGPSISLHDIVFDGSAEAGLLNKKLVAVEL